VPFGGVKANVRLSLSHKCSILEMLAACAVQPCCDHLQNSSLSEDSARSVDMETKLQWEAAQADRAAGSFVANFVQYFGNYQC
jgi:hypothetical protein